MSGNPRDTPHLIIAITRGRITKGCLMEHSPAPDDSRGSRPRAMVRGVGALTVGLAVMGAGVLYCALHRLLATTQPEVEGEPQRE